MAVTDRYDLAIEHLLNQFQESADFKALLRVAFNRILDADTVLYDLENETDIDNAEGVWLDILGRIVGIKRPAAEFDQDKIFTYGALANELVDGDMEAAGTSAWTASTAVLSKQTTNPVSGSQLLRIAYNGSPGYYGYQYCVTAGLTYRVRGWTRSDGSAVPVVTDAALTPVFTGTTSTDWQYFDIQFSSPWTQVVFGSAAGSGYVEFDDCWVIDELNGGMGDPLKGYCGLQGLTDGDCEDAGTAAWSASGATALSKQTSNPVSGSRLLRVAFGFPPPYFAYQSVAVVGKRYRVTGWARSPSYEIPSVRDGAVTVWAGVASTAWQWFDASYLATSTDVMFGSTAGSGYVEFDDMTHIIDGGYYQSFEGLAALDGSFMSDTDFRALVKAKAGANFAIGTIPDIYTFVNTAFGFTPLVYNVGTRSVAVKIGSTISQNKKYLIETLGPRLAGVALGVIE